MKLVKDKAQVFLCFVSLLTCLIAFTSWSWAQSATSSLSGTVVDAKQAVVQGAEVTLSSSQTGFSRTLRTGDRGDYQFAQVPPASYQLTVSAPGFGTIKRDNVVLQVSSPATLNLTLEVAGQAVTVEVTDEAPTVNITDASLGHNFNSKQLIDLPSEGRDPVSILSLQPGVVYLSDKAVDKNDDSRSGSVSGARSDQTNVTIDGLDNNDQLNGYAFEGALRSTLDSIQEFRVTTSMSNADAGRSSGAQVTLVTKSGTNQFHGSAYEYNRPTLTTANDPFNKQSQLSQGLPNRPGKLIKNTFGASIGGPIQKDRMFFFATFEGQRKRQTEQVTRNVPSETLRQGILRYPCDTTEDPANCTATSNANFTIAPDSRLGANQLLVTMTPAGLANMDPNCSSGGTCPLGPGADPAALADFNLYPQPNSDAVGDLFDYRGFTFAGANPEKTNTYIAKLDYKLTANGNHSLFLRGNLQNDNLSDPPQFPGQPTRRFNTNNSKGIAVGYTALLRPTLINNFRYGYIRQGTGQSGVSSSSFSHFRGLDDSTAFTNSVYANVPVHNFVDDITWSRGKHTLQAGGNLRLIFNNRRSNEQNTSEAVTNVFWLDNAGIANASGPNSFCSPDPNQCSLDPLGFASQGYAAVASGFSTSYDFATAAAAGLLTQVNLVSNENKTGVFYPVGSLVPRNFRSWEGESYVQDQWKVDPKLTITAGLRYSLLQPPYETNGNQAAPTTSLNGWFQKRISAMQSGNTFRDPISLVLGGKANNGKPYWNWDYRDLAPRFSFAYAPDSKTSIRGGYGLYFDHFGQGVVNTFDRQGSFGLTTTLVNPAGFQDTDCVARFDSKANIPAGTFCGQNLSPAPPSGFPVTPPGGGADGSFAIYWGLDDKLKTPYSHVFSFSLTRELPKGYVVEASYIGRLGRRLLQEEDLAMPLDIVDPASKTDYFSAATQFSKLAAAGTPTASVQPIPYWENLFPTAASPTQTATQNLYDLFSGQLYNETTALFVADLFCSPGCASIGGAGPQAFNYWDDQFSSLYSWRSIGTSAYHGLQLTLRRPLARGLQFDFNYTYSKSTDVGSNAERVNLFETTTGGFGDQIINSWAPRQLYGVSDFDTKHQINANWLVELPFGKGRRFASNAHGVMQAILGGWQLTGLARWTSGFPFSISPGNGWATNWELQGLAIKTGNPGPTGTFHTSSGEPTIFKDPAQAIAAFRPPFPGESGQRNELRGPGYFGIDAGLDKTWKLTESQALTFSWEAFNVTNSVRFDAALAGFSNFDLTSTTNFGKYSSTLTVPRNMQFALRYTF